MKNKKVLIFIGITVILIGLISVLFFPKNKGQKLEPPKSSKKIPVKKEKCTSITGGSFNLIFNTDSEQSIDNMSVCVACAPATYHDLPTPIKAGYEFDGWYYDSELTNKVETTNTIDIKPVPKRDEDCIVGYEDITLYAKYLKKEEKQDQKKIEEQSIYQEKVIENNETSEPPENQSQVLVYTEKFKRPNGSVQYYDEYGSFSYPPNYRGPYLAVFGSNIVTAMAYGEVICAIGGSSEYGGILITKQTIFYNGKLEDYLVVINHYRVPNLNPGETFEPGQVIANSAINHNTGKGRRYSIYTYKEYNDNIKNKILACGNRYQCIDDFLKSILRLRIDPRPIME